MHNRNEQVIYLGTVHFPDGRPLPEVVTEEEAITFLRLDIDGPKDAPRPSNTTVTRLAPWQPVLGKQLRYSKGTLRFIDRLRKKREEEFKKALPQPSPSRISCPNTMDKGQHN